MPSFSTLSGSLPLDDWIHTIGDYQSYWTHAQDYPYYISTYRKDGIEGLDMGYSPGRRPRLTAKEMEELKDIVSNYLPVDVGFTARYNWTLALIVHYIQRKWGVTYSLKGAALLLHRLGLSYTRPTYTLKKADPNKQAEYVEKTFPTLKKLLNREINQILIEDESMIRDYQAIGRIWFLKGKQRIIPTYGQHKDVKMVKRVCYS